MKKYLFYIILGLISVISCTKDFDEINTNPNVAEKVDPDFLFPSSVVNTVKLLGDIEYNAGWTYGMYWTESGGAFVNFGTVDVTLEDWWRRFYINCLTSLSKIDELYGADSNYTNRVLIAKIWECYVYSQMVSFWGPVPYSDAINENIASSYDSESEIYHSLIDRLMGYADSLNADGDTYMTSADLIYEGNTEKWKKFARSLALRLAVQINQNDSEYAADIINQILAEPSLLISSNDDNAIFRWYPGPEQWNPLYQKFIYSPGDRKVNISEFLFMYLDPYADPRLSAYAEVAAASGEYSGRPITKSQIPPLAEINPNPHSGKSDNDYSKPGDMWFAEDGYFSLLMYPEVCFLRAEAAFLGITSESANTFYYAGIDASLKMFGKENKAESYKSTGGIAWGTYGAGIPDWIGAIVPEYKFSSEIKNPYKQIIVQSWLAMFPRGLDAWTLFRRTGIVQLPVLFSADPSNTEMPTFAPLPERFKYPNEEKVYNSNGYNEGLSYLEAGDLMYSPLFFSSKK